MYEYTDTHSSFAYLAADVFDTDSWRHIGPSVKFDIIFSDVDSPGAMSYAISMMLDLNLISTKRYQRY